MTQVRRVAAADVAATLPLRRVLAVATFALLTAVSARFSVYVPGMPVPVSLQTLVVLMSGLLLGARLGAAAQASYLAAGAAGLPVFAGGMGVAYLFGPTGGYLLAFPLAAAVAGGIAAQARGTGMGRAAALVVAAVAGTLVVYAGGWAQLTAWSGDAATALRLGVLPFLAGDAAKVAIAAILAGRLRRRVLSLL